jgi:predicted TIM-barrel fold metal-dependent hydrolase
MIGDSPMSQHEQGGQQRRFDRRNFLRRGAVATGASAFLAAQSAKTDPGPIPSHRDKPGGYIDAHSHIWTNDKRYPLLSPGSPASAGPPTALPEDLLKVARPSGVDRVVLIQPGGYGFDNSYMLDTIRGQPTVFRGVAVVDWHKDHPDAEMRKLKKHGVRGFRIYPDRVPGPPSFDGEGFQKMFRCAAKEQMTLTLLINPDALPIIPKYCERFPETPMAIDHLGRIGVEVPIQESDVKALLALAKYPRVKVKVSAFYALGEKRPPHDDLAPFIRRVYDAFGPQRLMWATDCPYQIQHETYEDSIALVRDRLSFLSSDDKDWMLRKTAEESFFKA